MHENYFVMFLYLNVFLLPYSFGRALIESAHVETTIDKGLKKSNYHSSEIALGAGEVVLSDPKSTQLQMPNFESGWWLRGFQVEIIDMMNDSVPLTEVYLHHVAFYDSNSAGADVCGGASLDALDSLWNIGAESRHTKTLFPDGFGYFVSPFTEWLANIHLIRTDGVANVKNCIECVCDQGGGSEACCPDGSKCPGGLLDDLPRAKKYKLAYSVFWEELNNTKNILPLNYYTIDAAACQLEFNIPATCPWSYRHSGTTANSIALNRTSLLGTGRFFPFDYIGADDNVFPSHCIATKSWTMNWTSPDVRLVFGKGHLHIGAINMSLSIRRNNLQETPGTVIPRYGTTNNWPNKQIAGDEFGYITGISNCDIAFTHLPLIQTGDILTVTAHYRTAPWFYGVMALFDIATTPAAAFLLPEKLTTT